MLMKFIVQYNVYVAQNFLKTLLIYISMFNTRYKFLFPTMINLDSKFDKDRNTILTKSL